MKTITIRGVDVQLADKLKEEAAKSGKSVNQVVIDLLRRQSGLEKAKRFTVRHHDMDHLFGKWSGEEFDRIQGIIDNARAIDSELWE